jgi:transposase
VLDAFHVVKLGTDADDACRRRVQQATRGLRGRNGDALYWIRMLLRAGAEEPTDRQRRRLAVGIRTSQWRAARVSLLARARTCSASSGGSRISNSAPRMAT